MKIDKITMTGADNDTSVQEMIKLTKDFPEIEWGILFSKNEGRNRYPSQEWKESLVGNNLPLSAHFCGWWSGQVLGNQNWDLINSLHPDYKRIQLNYNFSKSKGWDLGGVIAFAERTPGRSIILQYNKSNSEVLNNLKDKHLPSNLHFLYDASGGRGTEIQSINDPILDSYTGYAGGLNVENTPRICSIIRNHNNQKNAWIDMESGVRTNDYFDLSKVKTIVESIQLNN